MFNNKQLEGFELSSYKLKLIRKLQYCKKQQRKEILNNVICNEFANQPNVKYIFHTSYKLKTEKKVTIL